MCRQRYLAWFQLIRAYPRLILVVFGLFLVSLDVMSLGLEREGEKGEAKTGCGSLDSGSHLL